MTRPSEAEVTEAMVEAGVAAFESQAPRLVSRSPSYSDPLAVALRHSFVRHILSAALSTPPLPSAEPLDLSGYCVACGQEAGPHNTYGDAEGRHALNVYPNFSVCDSCLPSSDDTAPLTNEMEPEEAALRCWHNDFTGRCIPFEEIAEQLMRWTALRTTPPLPSAPEDAGWNDALLRIEFAMRGMSQEMVSVRHADLLRVTTALRGTTPPAAAQDTEHAEWMEAMSREIDHYRDLLADAYVTIGCAVESEDGLDGSEADRFQTAVRDLWPAAVDHPTVARWLALPEESPTPEAPDAARAAGGE